MFKLIAYTVLKMKYLLYYPLRPMGYVLSYYGLTMQAWTFNALYTYMSVCASSACQQIMIINTGPTDDGPSGVSFRRHASYGFRHVVPRIDNFISRRVDAASLAKV